MRVLQPLYSNNYSITGYIVNDQPGESYLNIHLCRQKKRRSRMRNCRSSDVPPPLLETKDVKLKLLDANKKTVKTISKSGKHFIQFSKSGTISDIITHLIVDANPDRAKHVEFSFSGNFERLSFKEDSK